MNTKLIAAIRQSARTGLAVYQATAYGPTRDLCASDMDDEESAQLADEATVWAQDELRHGRAPEWMMQDWAE